MKVVTIESRQLGVLQRHRVARVSRNNDILANLRRMGQNARETVENALAELDGILSRSSHGETLDSGMAEIGGKHECVIQLLLLLNRKSSPPVPVSVLVLLAARITAPELVSTAWPVLSNSWALIV